MHSGGGGSSCQQFVRTLGPDFFLAEAEAGSPKLVNRHQLAFGESFDGRAWGPEFPMADSTAAVNDFRKSYPSFSSSPFAFSPVDLQTKLMNDSKPFGDPGKTGGPSCCCRIEQ